MSPRQRKHDLPRGIRRTPHGYEANVGVGGKTKWKRFRFPPGTSEQQAIEEIQVWRWSQKPRARAIAPTPIRTEGETFQRAVDRYLPAKAAMPSYKDRVRELKDWIAALGADTPRAAITRVQIQSQREQWVLARKSASWINNRLNALSNLWTVLDGRRAPNPAREVPLVDRPDPEPRGLPYALVAQILAALPDRARREKGNGYLKDPGQSKTKARLAVIAYTGLAHIQVKRLQPADVNLEQGWIFVRSRKKGAPGRPKGRVKPLTAEGIAALRHFAAVDAWGPFSNSSVWKSFQRACTALANKPHVKRRWLKHGINLTQIRPYDLRHSYASAVLEGTGNLAETQQLMAHADLRTTMRYAMAAVPAHLTAAVQRVQLTATRGRR
jgi:integrase